MMKMINPLFFILIILSGCSEDTVTTDPVATKREFHSPEGIYVETRSLGGGILKDMKPLPKEMKKRIVKHMTESGLNAVLGPCHVSFGFGIERDLWFFDDHTCLIISSSKEEDGWYHGKPEDGFNVIKGKKIADYEIRRNYYYIDVRTFTP